MSGRDKAESVLSSIRNRKQLQLAYLLAFNPLYLAYQLKKARNTSEEHESLQHLLPAALSLHRRLPEDYNGDPVALKKASDGAGSLHRFPPAA